MMKETHVSAKTSLIRTTITNVRHVKISMIMNVKSVIRMESAFSAME